MKSYDIVEYGAALKAMERPTPKPSGTEVLLKVTAAGVCHSDVHIADGYFDMGGGKRLNMADRGMKLPHTLGHETVGEVVACGPEAKGVKPGDQRLVYPWIGCGSCDVCKDGLENHCMAPRYLGIQKPGGYADHIIAPHPRYLLDIGTISPAEAAPHACSGLTTYSALRKFDTLQRHPLVIIGAGGLGLQCIAIHKALGGKAAISVDISPAKREAALKAGAVAAVDGAAPDAVAQLKQAAGGAVWSVLDLVGGPTTVQLAFDSISKGGKLVVVGLYGGQITVPLPFIPQRAITIQGSYTGSLREMEELLALVRQGKVPRIPMGTRPLDDAPAALAELKAGKVIGRTVLTPKF